MSDQPSVLALLAPFTALAFPFEEVMDARWRIRELWPHRHHPFVRQWIRHYIYVASVRRG